MDEIYRYPGIMPFSEKDHGVFFGRDNDIERLYHSILLNQCTVIIGKSGIGKTSLIYAGLKPRIEKRVNECKGDERHFTILPIRVGIWTETEKQRLIDKVKQLISDNTTSSPDYFLTSLPQHLKQSLWYKLKEIQFQNDEKTNPLFLLIFDQLEELFTYPFEQFKELLKEFKEIMTNNLPDEVREAVEDREPGDHPIPKNELRALYNPLPVKLLLAIRSDKLNLLNRLRDAIPTIYQNPVELRPLSHEQAAKAIKEPASQKTNAGTDEFVFKTDPFEIEADTVEVICNFLESQPNTDLDSNFEEFRIEPFTLQLICQHIERNILPFDQDKKITAVELGDMNEIIKNYYEDVLNKLQVTEPDKQNVRKLIEEEMIYEADQRRLILYKEIIINEFNISESLLSKLVDAKLLRELSAASSKSSYEISHDWMVTPILNAKKERLGLSTAQKFGGAIVSLEQEAKKNPNDYSLYKRMGDYYYFLQDYNTALVKYSQAIRLKEQLGVKGGDLELYFNRADCSLKLKEYISSIQDLKVVLAIEPRHLLANYYIAYNCHMLKEYPTAKEFYQRVIDIDVSYSNAYYNLGLVCDNLNELEDSYNYFLQTTKLNPKDYEAYYRLGILTATKLSKPEEAISFFNKSIELNTAFEDAYIQLAYVYALDLLDNDKAISILQSLVQHNPQNKDAWKGLGYIYHALKKYPEASQNFYKVISLDPKDADVFYRLCSLANDQGKYSNAVSFANSCLQLNPNHINVYLEKGYAHRMLQQLDDSIACYKKALELDPKNETAARNLEAIHQYEENETELLKLVDQNPSDANSFFELGVLSNNKQKYREAIDYFIKALEIKPGNTEALLELAYAYYQLKETGKAIESYKKIIEINPKDAAAYLSLGKVYDSLGQFEEATRYLEKAVELDASDQDSLYRLGLIANDKQEYEKAIDFFDRTLKIKPDHTNALIEKGYALYTSSHFEEALDCYKNILTYEPNNAKAYYGLGISYNMMANYEEAYVQLLKAVELNPTYSDAYYGLGLLADQKKDYAKAISYFEHCIAIEPGKTEPYDYLAYYSMQVKDYETAARYYKHLVQLNPQHANWNFNLGLAMKQMNNAEEALIYFKNAVALKKNDAEAMYTIGEIYEELNNQPEANRYFEQAAALDPKYAVDLPKEHSINSSSL